MDRVGSAHSIDTLLGELDDDEYWPRLLFLIAALCTPNQTSFIHSIKIHDFMNS